MGDLIELESRIAGMLGDQEKIGFETFLVEEGLELLADFRSIEDAAVRKSIAQMVSKIAVSLNSK